VASLDCQGVRLAKGVATECHPYKEPSAASNFSPVRFTWVFVGAALRGRPFCQINGNRRNRSCGGNRYRPSDRAGNLQLYSK
jgi:hypothetical protein